MPAPETQRLNVLLAAYADFAEFQILPCLYLLRERATVVTAGPDRNPLRSECGLTVVPQAGWDELHEPSFALVLVPGAPDMQAACEAPRLHALLQRCAARGALFGATSGGALVLHFAGLLAGRDYTTSITAEGRATLGLDAARYREVPVVADGNLVTAKGYAALDFAIAVARRLGVEADVRGRIDYLRGAKP